MYLNILVVKIQMYTTKQEDVVKQTSQLFQMKVILSPEERKEFKEIAKSQGQSVQGRLSILIKNDIAAFEDSIKATQKSRRRNV